MPEEVFGVFPLLCGKDTIHNFSSFGQRSEQNILHHGRRCTCSHGRNAHSHRFGEVNTLQERHSPVITAEEERDCLPRNSRPLLLTSAEDHTIVEVCREFCSAGTPTSRIQLRYLCRLIVECLPESRRIAINFKKNIPGKEWILAF